MSRYRLRCIFVISFDVECSFRDVHIVHSCNRRSNHSSCSSSFTTSSELVFVVFMDFSFRNADLDLLTVPLPSWPYVLT